jgi:ATP-dependent Zn protease
VTGQGRSSPAPPRRHRRPGSSSTTRWRRIVAEAHDEVVTLLTENRVRLDALASALLERETLDEDDAYAAAGVTRPQATPAVELAAAARSRT